MKIFLHIIFLLILQLNFLGVKSQEDSIQFNSIKILAKERMQDYYVFLLNNIADKIYSNTHKSDIIKLSYDVTSVDRTFSNPEIFVIDDIDPYSNGKIRIVDYLGRVKSFFSLEKDSSITLENLVIGEVYTKNDKYFIDASYQINFPGWYYRTLNDSVRCIPKERIAQLKIENISDFDKIGISISEIWVEKDYGDLTPNIEIKLKFSTVSDVVGLNISYGDSLENDTLRFNEIPKYQLVKQHYFLVGENLGNTPVEVIATPPFKISLNEKDSFLDTIWVDPINGNIDYREIFVSYIPDVLYNDSTIEDLLDSKKEMRKRLKMNWLKHIKQGDMMSLKNDSAFISAEIIHKHRLVPSKKKLIVRAKPIEPVINITPYRKFNLEKFDAKRKSYRIFTYKLSGFGLLDNFETDLPKGCYVLDSGKLTNRLIIMPNDSNRIESRSIDFYIDPSDNHVFVDSIVHRSFPNRQAIAISQPFSLLFNYQFFPSSSFLGFEPFENQGRLGVSLIRHRLGFFTSGLVNNKKSKEPKSAYTLANLPVPEANFLYSDYRLSTFNFGLYFAPPKIGNENIDSFHQALNDTVRKKNRSLFKLYFMVGLSGVSGSTWEMYEGNSGNSTVNGEFAVNLESVSSYNLLSGLSLLYTFYPLKLQAEGGYNWLHKRPFLNIGIGTGIPW